MTDPLSSAARIRFASLDDAAQIQSIYGPFVQDTPVSFEVQVPTVEEMVHRIRGSIDRFPWLVCEHYGKIRGYVYANPHSDRAAYAWSVNVSVYIAPTCHRSGVG